MGIVVTFSTDWHIADKGPSSRTDDYRAAVFDKLGQIQKVALKLNADLNVCGGDVFDVKNPRGNSHSLTRQTIETLLGFPCKTKVVVGNHDIFGDNHETLERQPLGVILEARVMTVLDDYIIEKDGLKVRFVGLKYGHCEYEDFAKIERGDEDVLVVVAHTFASAAGGVFYQEEVLKYSKLSKYPIDVFAFGHWHIDQGVKVVDGKHFINIGSLMRGSLAKDNLTRSPKCCILAFEKTDGKVETKIKQVRLKVAKAEEIFNLEEKAREEAEKEEIEDFLSKLKSESASDDIVNEGIESRIEGYDLSEEVRKTVDHYLELARVEIGSG